MKTRTVVSLLSFLLSLLTIVLHEKKVQTWAEIWRSDKNNVQRAIIGVFVVS